MRRKQGILGPAGSGGPRRTGQMGRRPRLPEKVTALLFKGGGGMRRLLFVSLAAVLASWFPTGCRERVSETTPPSETAVPGSAPTQMRTFEVGRSTREFDLEGATELTIDNRFGDVEVGAGGPRVRVESVVYARGADLADARTRAAGLAIEGGPDPEAGFTIAVRHDAGTSEIRADLVVAAPSHVGLKVRVGSGDVRASALTGNAEVRASSGDLRVEDVAGSVSAETTSGDVRVSGVGGDATVRCGSGSAAVAGVEGPALVRTLSGDITLRDVRGDEITTSTGSGEIDIRLSLPWAGNLEARSNSGRITVALSPNSNCRVRTATGSGDIASELPLTDVSRQGRNISGRLGRGEGLVDVATGSGDIRLLPAK